ncbi:MAG: hypothetical protein B6I36_09505 [Desulfobacteraceae bacterium 4572_35.1]|nr:MAG: hypothetical protein B6I36_09505 [Desulfobacteraceae bacterium 4572_35.1]
MVPESVTTAWEQLIDKKKGEICRLCARQQPAVFERWIDAAGLKSFRYESVVKRKAGAASRLDAVLFKAEDGHLAADLLIGYFTGMAPHINEKYLELLESSANEDNATKLQIYAQLANDFASSPVIDLYLATALWIEEFDEGEIETVKELAAKL